MCGEATQDYFVPLNDWVPTDLRLIRQNLTATIRPVTELQHGGYGSHFSQGAYKAYYRDDIRYLFKRGYSVSLKGKNLCVAEPEIFIWKNFRKKNRALQWLFIQDSMYIKECMELLASTIQAQCKKLPETIKLSYTMRKAYAERERIIKEKGMPPRDFEYYQSRVAGAAVEYTDIYRATFYPKRFVSGMGLLTTNNMTSEYTALRDERPEIRQAFVEADNKYKARIELAKRIKRAQREREINEMYGPIAAIGMAVLQSFALEFADEGVCAFLTHDRRRFSKNDYIRCQRYLHDFQKQLNKDHKAYYALGKLIASMSKNQPRLVPEGNNQAERQVNNRLNKCAKALVKEFGSKRHGDVPTEKELIQSCTNAAIR